MTYRSSKSVHICALSARRRIKQKNFFKKVYLRNHNTCFFTCSPRPPTLSQRHMDLHVWSYPIMYSNFHRNPFRGFGPQGVKIWPFPLLWLVAFTTACTTVQAVIHTCIPYAKFACMHAYMHACMHTCMHSYMHACIHTCMHTCMHACIHAYMYTCINAYMHTCIHTYIHTYIYIIMYTCK